MTAEPEIEGGGRRATGMLERPVRRVISWWWQSFLRVPLAGKIAGANALLILTMGGALTWHIHSTRPEIGFAVLVILMFSFGANYVLVRSALKPVRELERVAGRAQMGDLDARVPPSETADRELADLADTLNTLIATVASDRRRLHQYATDSAAASDGFRQRLGHELHERMAQRATAVLLQLSALSRECSTAASRDRAEHAAESMSELVEEIRSLAVAVHPPALDQLGLVPALRSLATRAAAELGIDVSVGGVDRLPLEPTGRAVLYAVVREAIELAAERGCTQVAIELRPEPNAVNIQILDDGLASPDGEVRHRDFLLLRDRLELLGGALHTRHTPGVGAHINVTLPKAEVATCLKS